MSKSVLVIDTPQTCKDCACFSALYDRVFCGATDEIIEYDYDTLEYIKPSWCPLSPLPDRRDLKDLTYGDIGISGVTQYNYRQGWNDCIDSIIGDRK